MTGPADPHGPGRTPDGLVVERLGVALPDPRSGWSTVLHEVDLRVPPGRVVVLLGPSGAGKSTTLAALLGMLPPGALVRGGARWHGTDETCDLLHAGTAERERLRGRTVAWLPQAPVATLTPVLTVGAHLREKARVHASDPRAVQDLVTAASRRHEVEPAWWRRLPSQLSGGQAQRVSNALSLLGDPALVLADEPTAGLDAARARAAGQLLSRLAHEEGRAVLAVTHDLALAEQVADEVVVLDAGRTVESGDADRLVARARTAAHRQVPHRTAREALAAAPTGRELRVDRLTVVRGADRVVLRDLSLAVPRDRTTGLMAPSGSGKTTLLRTLALLHPPRSGAVVLDGIPLKGWGYAVPARVRRRIGYVAQDPRGAVDPRWTVGQIVAEPLRLAGRQERGRRRASVPEGAVVDLLARVGLPPDLAGRRPDEVSGGQLQRVVVARALALDPDYLLLDEPTSMVDAATAVDVLSAVHRHQHATGCGVLVASHDEELLRRWCDTVLRWED